MKLVYATFCSKDEAKNIAKILLEEKLIACANIVEGGLSIYEWQGEIKHEAEAYFFAKTTEKLAEKTIARIKQLHSYDTPCILLLPVEGGDAPFIAWVESQLT